MKPRLLLCVLLTLTFLSAPAAAITPPPPRPQPDNPITGKPSKPTRGLWIRTRLKGRTGWWWCYLPPGYLWDKPVHCWRHKPKP
jgi:hypothetical protein